MGFPRTDATGNRGRLGFVLGQQRTAFAPYLEQWTRAEKAGLELGYVFDHLVDEARSRSTTWLDCYAVLAALAVSTTRVRLGVLVTGAGLRHPVHVAKTVATIDHISGGRFELGLGAGGAASDHEVLGAPMPPLDARIATLEDALRRIRSLLAAEPVDEAGEVVLEPLPVQSHLPVTLGGNNLAIVELAGRAADGWNCYQMDESDYQVRMEALRRAEADAARPPGSVRQSVVVKFVEASTRAELDRAIQVMARRCNLSFDDIEGSIVAGGPDDWVEQLQPLVACGARDLIADLEADEPATNARVVSVLVHEVMPALTRATGFRWGRSGRKG